MHYNSSLQTQRPSPSSAIMEAKRRLSHHMCALVMVGCGVGLTTLKQAPLLRYTYVTEPTRRQTTISGSSRDAITFQLLRLDAMSSQWTGSDGPRRKKASPSIRTKSRSNSAQQSDVVPSPPSATSATNTTDEPRRQPKQSREFYSVARVDRSGSAIEHMTMALAYGYATNATYKGACYPRKIHERKRAAKDALIRSVGLQDVLVSACPPTNRTDLILTAELSLNHRNKAKLFSPAFVAWLRSRATPRPKAPGGLAVVHVRRGDVDPCSDLKYRYLPCSYYVEVIQRHIPLDVPVIVFSESASFEPFTEFVALRSLGYNITIHLDANVVKVWKTIMAASHFVMSRTTFTFLPALLNVNSTILYPTGCLQQIMPEWKQVDDDILNRSAFRVEELVEQRCHNYTSFAALF